jgi:hypothetical protein
VTDPTGHRRQVASGTALSRLLPVALMAGWPLAVAWTLEEAGGDMMMSVVAFLLLPILPLIAARPRTALSAIAYSLLVGAPAIVWIDEIAQRNGQWLVVDPLATRLPLIEASLQSVFWAVAHFLATVMAWETLRDVPYRTPDRRRVLICTAASLAVLGAFIAIRTFRPALLDIAYFYLLFGLILIVLPVAWALAARPRLRRPLVILAAAGCYWKLVYEVAALRNDWWRFPGEFIGWVRLGPYAFPIEELVIWIILFSPAIAVFWEFWKGPDPASRDSGIRS